MRRSQLLLTVLVLVLLLSAPLADAAKKKKKAKKEKAPAAASSGSPSEAPPKSERDDDPVIQEVRGLRNSAMRENDKKEYNEAIEKLREALTLMHHRVFGEGRAAVKKKEDQSMDAALYSQLLTDYGGVLIRAKQYDEAIDVLEDAIEMIKRVFGESHPSLGLSLRSLADAYLAKKEYKTAIKKYKELRKHVEIGLGVTHEAYIEVHLKIAEAYKSLNNIPRAVKALKHVIEEQGGNVNGATQGIGEVFMELATLQLKTRELEDAERAAMAARAIMHQREGETSLQHAFSLNALAGVKMSQNKVEEAYSLLQHAHRIALQLYGKNHAMVKSSQKTLDQVRLRLEDDRTTKAADEHIEL